MPTKKTLRGFTVTETIMVMVLVAILAALAIPSFTYVTNANRASGEVNGLLGDMQFARSQAIREGQTVTICSSASPYTQCTGAGGTAWESGWIVFSDFNHNQSVDGSEPVLRVQSAFSGGDTLQADNNFFAATFNREGFATTLSTNPVTLTLHAATPSSASTRCLTVSVVGMVATLPYQPGTCQ